MQAPSPQQKNLDFFERELSRLLGDVVYKGKFVVIHDEQVKGAYDSFDTALSFAVSNFPANEFLVQQVIDENERINFIRSAIA
jgi:hypothetical protein